MWHANESVILAVQTSHSLQPIYPKGSATEFTIIFNDTSKARQMFTEQWLQIVIFTPPQCDAMSTFAQVMACWLATAPSHYLDQWWRITKGGLWYWRRAISHRRNLYNVFEDYTLKITSEFPSGKSLAHIHLLFSVGRIKIIHTNAQTSSTWTFTSTFWCNFFLVTEFAHIAILLNTTVAKVPFS